MKICGIHSVEDAGEEVGEDEEMENGSVKKTRKEN